MSQAFLRPRGETMIEVLVAIMIVIVGAMAALASLDYFSTRQQVAKELVIANNLSREGIEAVRTIRDTNWLRYSGERRNCWNNADPTNQDCSSDTNKIRHQGSYRVELDPATYRFALRTIANRLNVATGVTGDGTSSYTLKRDPVTGVYSYASGATTKYSREIYTEYVGDDGNSAPPDSCVVATSNIPRCAHALRVTSTVEWVNRKTTYQTRLTTVLTDYLGRTNHE